MYVFPCYHPTTQYHNSPSVLRREKAQPLIAHPGCEFVRCILRCSRKVKKSVSPITDYSADQSIYTVQRTETTKHSTNINHIYNQCRTLWYKLIHRPTDKQNSNWNYIDRKLATTPCIGRLSHPRQHSNGRGLWHRLREKSLRLRWTNSGYMENSDYASHRSGRGLWHRQREQKAAATLDK